MARINNREKYPQDAEVTAEDFLTGSDHRTGQTKTYKISSILALGGNPPVGDTAASLSGNTITFPDGQTIQIPTDTDTNTFATINSGIITFANGDTVNLGSIDTDTFATLSNDILTLADGSTYNLADTAATLAGSVITFPTGQTITVPNPSTDDQVASEVPVQTSNFNGNLRPTDNTVQKALDRIDDLDISANNNYTIDVIGDTVNLLNNGTIISSDTLTTLASSITNTSTGNTIATHISGSGVQTDIAESITRLNINANILEYTREDGIVDTVDLSLYLDDTNLARLVSGVIDSNTNIATFTRDDNSTFTIDFSSILGGKEDVSNKQTDLLSTAPEHYPNVLSVVEASKYGVPNNSTNLGRIRFSLGSPNSNNTSISDEGDAMILPTTLSNNVLVRKSYQDSLPVEERLNILDKEAGVYILSIALLSNSGGTHRYKIDASKIQLIGDVYVLPAEEVVESPNSTDINIFVIDNVSSYTVSTKLVEVVKDEDIAVLQNDLLALQNSQLSGFISYQTEAELLAHPNPITTEAYRVTNDTDPSKNGTYTYDGSNFVQDAFPYPLVSRNKVGGKNIFNKLNIINDYFLSNANPSNLVFRAGSICTDFIPVEDAKGVYIQGRDFNVKTFACFDKNQNLLEPIFGSVNYSTGPVNGFYALQPNTKFIRFNIQVGSDNVANLDAIQVEYSLTATPYEAYFEQRFLAGVGDSTIQQEAVSEKVIGNNLFDPLSHLLGTSIENTSYSEGLTDVLLKDNDSSCSRLIKCKPNTNYYIQGRLGNIKGFAFYDINGNILPPVQGSTYWGGVANGIYTSSPSGEYMRFQVSFGGNGDPTLIQIKEASTSSVFEPYVERLVLREYNGFEIPRNEGGLPSAAPLRRYDNQAVRLINDELVVIGNYNRQFNVVTVMTRQLRNNLFMLKSIYLVESEGYITDSDFNKTASFTMLDGSLTDVLSPYMLNDGHDYHPSPFVAGNHGHGATPTASMLYYNIFADGIRLNDGDLLDAKVVQVNTVNEVYLYSGQAQTPTLNSVAFNEYQSYTIINGTINVNVGLEVKQDIEFIKLYSIQGTPFLSDIDSVYVANTETQTITPYITEQNRNFGRIENHSQVDRAIFINDVHKHSIAHFIDKSFGLAQSPQIEGFPFAFFETVSSGKVYFNLINLDRGSGINYSAGDYISYRGGFNVFKNIAENTDEIAYVKEGRGFQILVIDIARSTTDSRVSIFQISEYIDREIEVLEKTDTITINNLVIDARGVVVNSVGYGNIKLKIKNS